METERPRRIHHAGFKGFCTNRLVLKVILAIEFVLWILFTVALGLTLAKESALFLSVIVFAFHFASPTIGFAMLENVRDCEAGRCKRNRYRRFGWFMGVLVVLTTDVYSSVEFLMHNSAHLAGYHYLTIITFITGAALDVFYLALIVAFRK